ncbi:hypothetical protein [Mesorhizobium sp.]|uniref:SDH family Clp fold serine proteinase n=1 Tax=Mesorhizobium sp. TaxID=1871066 RepID=UPI000FE50BE5|nr:hypothetical protein [Mesorhizobium sp.]RWA81322.1 MAG: hypothetical protein EOQ30_19285 [Mesorhizobium sp.]
MEVPKLGNLADLASRIAKEEKADIYHFCGLITEDRFGLLRTAPISPRQSRAILILDTEGGDGPAAFQIARLFHKRYSKLIVYIPRRCKSAGTFVALGAHQLIMHPDAVMGPIDPQFRKHDEICLRESALSARAALTALGDAAYGILEQTAANLAVESEAAVSFRLGSQIGVDLTAGLMSQLVAKLDPTIFGTHQLALETAIAYGNRLVRASGNASEESVRRLVTNYPSHDFVIDFTEASEMFEELSTPTELLQLYGLTLLEIDSPDYAFCYDLQTDLGDAGDADSVDKAADNRQAA